MLPACCLLTIWVIPKYLLRPVFLRLSITRWTFRIFFIFSQLRGRGGGMVGGARGREGGGGGWRGAGRVSAGNWGGWANFFFFFGGEIPPS